MHRSTDQPHSRFLLLVVAAFLILVPSLRASDHWTALGPDGGTVTDLIRDPFEANTLYCSTRAGLFKSTEGGRIWRPIGRTVVAGAGAILAVDPVHPGVLFTVQNSRIYRSRDGGQGLDDRNVISLAVDPRNPQIIYARTVFAGMFFSTDGAMNWSQFTIDETAVLRISFHPASPVAYSTISGELLRRREEGPWEAIGLPPGGIGMIQFDPADPRAVFGANLRGLFRFPAPVWLYGAGDPTVSGDRFDGMAFSNPSPFDTEIALTINHPDSPGKREIAGNPAQHRNPNGAAPVLLLEAGEQVARLRGDLFEENPAQPGWVSALPDREIATFFQYGTYDLTRLDFAAALALQANPFSDAVFSQVGSLPGSFFTGLAFYYPDPDPVPATVGGSRTEGAQAELTIEIVRADGTSSGTAVRTLLPGERLSELVDQLVAAAAGQSGGYVTVHSSRPVIGQMLFGSTRLNGSIQLFSAVPPRTLQ